MLLLHIRLLCAIKDYFTSLYIFYFTWHVWYFAAFRAYTVNDDDDDDDTGTLS